MKKNLKDVKQYIFINKRNKVMYRKYVSIHSEFDRAGASIVIKAIFPPLP